LSGLLAEIGEWQLSDREWTVVCELLGQIRDARRRGDRAQLLQAVGQLETASLRVSNEPGPEELPEPPEVTEERNHLITELDLDMDSGRHRAADNDKK
jgi:CATRA-Associated Small Protein